ncbi:hypothetical protein E2C01_055921 [Portunus trituberculatus]|uniref:Uncharacterized protein n=1 Tax=Portunus trituberculatus TaxID=210409 RepID=A0A5B7GYY3_PORTR|nr:hypothetical protein [Portunus trituberculatus]
MTQWSPLAPVLVAHPTPTGGHLPSYNHSGPFTPQQGSRFNLRSYPRPQVPLTLLLDLHHISSYMLQRTSHGSLTRLQGLPSPLNQPLVSLGRKGQPASNTCEAVHKTGRHVCLTSTAGSFVNACISAEPVSLTWAELKMRRKNDADPHAVCGTQQPTTTITTRISYHPTSSTTKTPAQLHLMQLVTFFFLSLPSPRLPLLLPPPQST